MGGKWLKPELLKIWISCENCANTAKGDIKAGLYWCPISLVKHDRWWSRLYRYLSAENWYFIQHLALNQWASRGQKSEEEKTEACTAQSFKILIEKLYGANLSKQVLPQEKCISWNNSPVALFANELTHVTSVYFNSKTQISLVWPNNQF